MGRWNIVISDGLVALSGSGLTLGVEDWVVGFPPPCALWGSAFLSPQHPHLSAVNGSHGECPQTCWDRAGSLFALPRAKPGGPDSEVLYYSAKEFIFSPASIYKVETKPLNYMHLWPQAKSSSVISGELLPPQGKVQPLGETRALLSFPTQGGCSGGPSLVPSHPQEALGSLSLALNVFLILGLSTREQSSSDSFPWPSGDQGWVAGFLPQPWLVLVHSGTENHQVFCHCMWPGVFVSVCFEKL